jgi:hypothetical protein
VLSKTSTGPQFQTDLAPSFRTIAAAQYHYDVRTYLENLLAKKEPSNNETTLITKWKKAKEEGGRVRT